MIKIETGELIDMIDTAITDYNNQFWADEDFEKQIPYYDEENGISEETLSKLTRLKLPIRGLENYTPEERELLKTEILKIASHMSLDFLAVSFWSKNEKFAKESEFLKELLEQTKPARIEIRGIDLSSIDSSFFPNPEGLKALNISACNISEPIFLQTIPQNTSINITTNSNLDMVNIESFIEEVVSRNGKLTIGNKEFSPLVESIKALKSGEITLSQYEQLRGKIDFSKIQSLKIRLNGEYDFGNEKFLHLITELNAIKDLSIASDFSTYRKFFDKTQSDLPVMIVLENASELSVNDLDRYPSISDISIVSPHTGKEQQQAYNRDSYKAVREKIDEIISDISPSLSESQKFAIVYKRLGQLIEYDFNAIKDDMKSDEDLQTRVRNLYGGLIEGKAVCAGYADILWNILACVGVESRYVKGSIDFERGYTLRLSDPESGHAWNQVKLDGKWYYTDLTWDTDYIREGRFPLPYCLKSAKEFKGHERYDHEKNANVHKCEESFLEAEQKMLFTDEPEPTCTLNDVELCSLVHKSACLAIPRAEIIRCGDKLEQAVRENEIVNINSRRDVTKRGDSRDGR